MYFNKGEPCNLQWVVDEEPDAVIQGVIRAVRRANYPADRYSFALNGSASLLLTRKYRPVAGWIGWVPVTLILAPCLVYKKTETLTVTATAGPKGTIVNFAGAASTELMRSLKKEHSELSSMPIGSFPPPTNGAVAAWVSDPAGRHQLRYWDGSTWTDYVSDHGATGTDAHT